MDFLWALLILILALLLYTAVQILRFAGRTCRISALRRTHNAPVPAPKRPLRWISLADCPSILAATQDPVIIDLRPDSRPEPIPISALRPLTVLRVRTAELADVLEWLPPASGAIFYGVSGLCLSMIEASPGLRGSAPVYLLAERPARGEAA